MRLFSKSRIHISVLCLFAFCFGLTSQVSNAETHHHKRHISHHAKKKVVKKRRHVKKTIARSSGSFDQQYTRFLRRWGIPGSAVAIMQNDTLIVSRGYGWADRENRRPVQPDSVFRVASVSKAITSVAILQLVQQGKLSLNDKVYDILSDVQPLSNARPSSRLYDISVKNLLEMSSGWSTDKGIDPMLGAWSSRMLAQLQGRIPPDCRTAASLMMTMPMQYTPGRHYSYSNINYCLLGLIINKVTGRPGSTGYEAHVKQHLLSPFNVTTMQIGSTSPNNQTPNEVRYYYLGARQNDEANRNRLRDGLPYGQTNLLHKNYSDGGWIASAPDLVKFLQALGRNQILTPHTMSTLVTRPAFQTQPSNYFGLGWTVKYMRGHRYILKTGSFTGTQALIMLRDDGKAYAALFNAKPLNRRVFNQQLQSLLISQ